MSNTTTNQYKKLQQEYKLVKQQNQLLNQQLVESRHAQQQLKKLTEALIQSLGQKQPSETLRQIRLIIEGGSNTNYSRALELQDQLEKMHKCMQQEIEKRVKQLSKQLISDISPSKPRKCQRCIDYDIAVKKLEQQLQSLRAQLSQKKATINETSLYNKRDNEQIKELIKDNRQFSKQNSKLLQEIQEYCQELQELRNQLDQRQEQYRRAEEQWRKYCNELIEEKDETIQQLSRIEEKQRNNPQPMMREIQNIVGQLSKRSTNKSFKSKQSHVSTNPDYHNFSIKDAINRPNRGMIFY